MQNKIIIIIAPHNFQEREFFESKKIFEQNGLEINIASITSKSAISSSGTSLKPDMALKEIDINDYDCFVIIGGFGARDYLWNNLELRNILQKTTTKKKIIAAICLAPVVLAKAGLLSGLKATVHKNKDSLNEFKINNVKYLSKSVVVDGNIITGKGPKSSKEFALKIIELINKKT
ncbi:MAG: DJ-1/PfpI family protein [Candidatus Omnitrophota bacterium]